MQGDHAVPGHLFTLTSIPTFAICQFVGHSTNLPAVMLEAAALAATVALPVFAKTCPAIYVLKDLWALDPSRLQFHDHCGRPGQYQHE